MMSCIIALAASLPPRRLRLPAVRLRLPAVRWCLSVVLACSSAEAVAAPPTHRQPNHQATRPPNKQTAKQADRQTTIVFTGDILLDRGVRRIIEAHGPDEVFSPRVDSVLSATDFVVGNLECPATKVRQPVFKRFVFRGEPEWLPALRRHGFTHLNLANNHSIDQGRAGLMDTRRQINAVGMTPLGADSTMDAASQPVLVTTTPRPVYLLPSLRLRLENTAYLPQRPSISQEPFDSLVARVRALRDSVPTAAIIVNLHWGWEHHFKPLPQQRIEARRLIDAGADAIIGHHSHTLQSVEDYRGRTIYYGIGNFIFDQQKPMNSEAVIVRMTVTKDTITTQAIPVLSSMPKVRLLPGN